jgi:TPR repeat protein
MRVKYCDAACQKKHWPKHKKDCKIRTSELRDEALFKDPPAKEDCPICFLPMPSKLICCVSLPPATISSVPIDDFAKANEDGNWKLANIDMCYYYECCGKNICRGCGYSVIGIAQNSICPFCNSDRRGKTDEEKLAEMMKRVEANDSGAIYVLANNYYHGRGGLQQDEDKALELYARAAELGWSMAYYGLACIYHGRGDLKKAKFHFEAAAMAGHEIARFNLGCIEKGLGNMERAIKHLEIAASAGNYVLCRP